MTKQIIKVSERKFTPYPNEPRKQVAATKSTLFVEPGRVGVAYANHVTGLNRHSGKRWYRWEQTGGSSFYLTKSGKIAGKKRIGKTFVSQIDFHTARVLDFAPHIKENVGEIDFDKIFPGTDHWGISTQEQIPAGLTSAMREADLPSLVREAFGKTRYRRDLVKSVGRAPISAVGLGREFRGFVPIDWIVNFLRVNEQGDEARARYAVTGKASIRPILFTIDPRSYRDLLKIEMQTRDWYQIEDIIRMMRQAKALRINIPLPPGRYRSWLDIHDAMEQVIYENRGQFGQRKSYVQTKMAIPQTVLAERIDSQEADGYKFVTAKDTDELIAWGLHMRNCIGSYGWQVAREDADSTLGAIYKGAELIANFEIKDGSLKQLLGRFNRSLGADVRGKLEPVFVANDVVVDNYWGNIDD